MVKVSLIVYANGLNMIGVRSLSAFLKSKGYNTQIIYMLSPYYKYHDVFSDNLYEQVMDACRDSDLIGFSVTSNFHLEAVRATRKLKKLNKPVVWGGIHPTLFPEGCIKEVDIISRGESEDSLCELAEAVSAGRDYSSISNLWVRSSDKAGSEIINRNPLRPFIGDLDKIPFCDLDFTSHLAVDEGHLRPITHELMKRYMISGNTWSGRFDYYISTSRGCPYHCTYCCNNGLQQLYGGVHIRRRGAENVIKELEEVLKRYPFINYIFLSDEEIFVQPLSFIKKFGELFKSRIGLPLKIEFTPSSFNEEKFKMFIDAGMVECHMGVQSGCEETNRNIYERNIKTSHIQNILKILKFYSRALKKCWIHFIVFNALESEASTKQTLRFIADMDTFFDLRFFPIIYYPGTALYEKVKNAGIIDEENYIYYLANSGFDELKEIFRSDYYTFCFMLLYRLKKKMHLSLGASRMLYRIFVNPLFGLIFKYRISTKYLAGFYLLLHSLFRLVKRVMHKT